MNWYLRHFELVAIVPALAIGYISAMRFPRAIVGKYVGDGRSHAVAVWVWIVPVLILAYKMALHYANSSVLYPSSISSAVKYFFDIQQVVPTVANPLAGDASRALAQLTVTAPFYAGVAYSLGALVSKRKVLTNLFRSESLPE
jgi:hypothetical protein